ncbi:NADP-dependent oxidoreductase [Kribbella deserti]|uniref:NADP-dependent oxidoreductase n=1 Tax=Kribbella deserti TaxID=1926257 RepID=A0ABV6QTH0_9ACTN
MKQLLGAEIRLAARPVGEPAPADFELVTAEVPEPGPGEVLVRNTWMSVDPYMRGRMDDVPGALPPFALGSVLEGGAIGEVVGSNDPDLKIGDTVTHFAGWREYSVVGDATRIDTTIAPPQAYLGVLGATGLTAYAALTDVLKVKPGDVVFVSAAAGAVGSVAGQLARRFGAAKVIGSAGGPLKTKKLIEDFGFDAAIDYKAGDLAARLAAEAPDGIDAYVDNVGGDHLEAALDRLKVGGRAALVGSISGYNQRVPGPSNLMQVTYKSLTLQGLQVTSYLHLFGEYIGLAAPVLADGTLHAEETVVAGLAQAPEALIGVLRGANTGKMLVKM